MSQEGHIHASALSYATGLLGSTAPVIALVNRWVESKSEDYIENLSYPEMRSEVQAVLSAEISYAAEARQTDRLRKLAQRQPRQQESITMSDTVSSPPPVTNAPTPAPAVPPSGGPTPVPTPPVTNQPPVAPVPPVESQSAQK